MVGYWIFAILTFLCIIVALVGANINKRHWQFSRIHRNEFFFICMGVGSAFFIGATLLALNT